MARRRRSLVELSHVGAVALALLVQPQQLPRLVPPVVVSPVALPAFLGSYSVPARAAFSTASPEDDPSADPSLPRDDQSNAQELLYRLKELKLAQSTRQALLDNWTTSATEKLLSWSLAPVFFCCVHMDRLEQRLASVPSAALVSSAVVHVMLQVFSIVSEVPKHATQWTQRFKISGV
ncbi:hypothetical protein PINS_up015262 [Pythium insidiosum]|nr:hypothetical protein PINS_up015262 [Pythium insidiosum]